MKKEWYSHKKMTKKDELSEGEILKLTWMKDAFEANKINFQNYVNFDDKGNIFLGALEFMVKVFNSNLSSEVYSTSREYKRELLRSVSSKSYEQVLNDFNNMSNTLPLLEMASCASMRRDVEFVGGPTNSKTVLVSIVSGFTHEYEGMLTIPYPVRSNEKFSVKKAFLKSKLQRDHSIYYVPDSWWGNTTFKDARSMRPLRSFKTGEALQGHSKSPLASDFYLISHEEVNENLFYMPQHETIDGTCYCRAITLRDDSVWVIDSLTGFTTNKAYFNGTQELKYVSDFRLNQVDKFGKGIELNEIIILDSLISDWDVLKNLSDKVNNTDFAVNTVFTTLFEFTNYGKSLDAMNYPENKRNMTFAEWLLFTIDFKHNIKTPSKSIADMVSDSEAYPEYYSITYMSKTKESLASALTLKLNYVMTTTVHATVADMLYQVGLYFEVDSSESTSIRARDLYPKAVLTQVNYKSNSLIKGTKKSIDNTILYKTFEQLLATVRPHDLTGLIYSFKAYQGKIDYVALNGRVAFSLKNNIAN